MLSRHLKVSGARVHDPTKTCSNLSYFLIRLDLTLNLRLFVPRLQTKGWKLHPCGGLGEVSQYASVLGRQLCMSVSQLPYIKREPSSTFAVLRENEETWKLFFLPALPDGSCISQDLLKTNVELEVFSHFQPGILSLSSSLLLLKFERWFVMKRFGSFMIHWAGYPARMVHQELSAYIACVGDFR